jgi:hypothetical protein
MDDQMEQTMNYSGCDTPFIGGIGADRARCGRFASRLGGIAVTGQWMWIRNMAGPRIAFVHGSSVPGGRRLRT